MVTRYLVLFVVFSGLLYSQEYDRKHPLTFSFGMGVGYGATPKFTEYLRNEIPYSNSDTIPYYNGNVEFFGGLDYGINRNFSVRVDYSFYTRNINYTYNIFSFDYTINSHQPYIFLNYIFRNPKINLRFGLGAGYHFQDVISKTGAFNEKKYNSNGFGLRLETAYNLRLSKNFYGIFNIFGYTNFYSLLKDENGITLKATNTNKEASLSGYGIGARLGFAFILN